MNTLLEFLECSSFMFDDLRPSKYFCVEKTYLLGSEDNNGVNTSWVCCEN